MVKLVDKLTEQVNTVKYLGASLAVIYVSMKEERETAG